jgi:hypothetical protein
MATGERARIFSKRALGGDLVGLSVGTGVSLIAQVLPENSPVRPWLLSIAPSIAVGVRSATAWCASQVGEAYKAVMRRRKFREAKEALVNCLTNPLTSDEHKKNVVARLERLESVDIDEKIGLYDKVARNESSGYRRKDTNAERLEAPGETPAKASTNQTDRSG